MVIEGDDEVPIPAEIVRRIEEVSSVPAVRAFRQLETSPEFQALIRQVAEIQRSIGAEFARQLAPSLNIQRLFVDEVSRQFDNISRIFEDAATAQLGLDRFRAAFDGLAKAAAAVEVSGGSNVTVHAEAVCAKVSFPEAALRVDVGTEVIEPTDLRRLHPATWLCLAFIALLPAFGDALKRSDLAQASELLGELLLVIAAVDAVYRSQAR